MVRAPKRQNRTPATDLRIVGGHFRGRKLKYAGDPRVRPMKDRTREAIFNLLGPNIDGMLAIDLFGGTGALALEAISRGASSAVILERHRPTAEVIQDNIATLDLGDAVQLIVGDAFRWRQLLQPLDTNQRCLVFISPPYRLFVDRQQDMTQLVAEMIEDVPDASFVVVEATKDFDFAKLPRAEAWDVRSYPPAEVGLLEVVKP